MREDRGYINILVLGADGRMGRLAVKEISSRPDMQVVGALVRGDSLSLASREAKVDVVVDLTGPDSVFGNAHEAMELGLSCVIGASGLTDEQCVQLQNLAAKKQLGACIIPNFSIAAVMMIKMAKLCADKFADVSIIERHHRAKKDAPSATAKHTAAMVAKYRKPHLLVTPSVSCYEESGISIHSIRSDGVVAEQEVLFGQSGESLSLTHVTHDRQAFMPGLLLCCQKVRALNHLVIGLEHFL